MSDCVDEPAMVAVKEIHPKYFIYCKDNIKCLFHILGLSELLLFIRKWVQKHNVKNIPIPSLDALFIAYGLGELQKSTGGWLVVSCFYLLPFSNPVFVYILGI